MTKVGHLSDFWLSMAFSKTFSIKEFPLISFVLKNFEAEVYFPVSSPESFHIFDIIVIVLVKQFLSLDSDLYSSVFSFTFRRFVSKFLAPLQHLNNECSQYTLYY